MHQGFYGDYLSTADAMLAAVNAYGGVNAPQIQVTGHSLGAAISQLAAYELLVAGYPVTTHVDFGRPRVGNPNFADAFYNAVVNHNFTAIKLHKDAASLRWSPVLAAAVNAAHESDPSVLRGAVVAGVRSAATELGKVGATASRTRAARHGAMGAKRGMGGAVCVRLGVIGSRPNRWPR